MRCLAVVLLLVMEVSAQQPDTYLYRFENSRFNISSVEVKLNAKGEGSIKYRKRDEDVEVNEELSLSQAAIQRFHSLISELNFLDSAENYNMGKNLEHMGTTTIRVTAASKEREVVFHYTSHKLMLRLVELFKAVENQHYRTSDLKFARQYSQLDLPKYLKILEGDLKSRKIAEPTQLLPLLEEISLDDTVPLIARNSAARIATQIKRIDY